MTYYQAENAIVYGNVELGHEVNIWHNAVIRGDEASIRIGEGTNIQDACILHVDEDYPLTIGKNCTIGHGAILHGCSLGDNVLVGMGAMILNGSRVGEGSIIGAGSLVLEGEIVPEGSILVGSPGKVRGRVSPEQKLDQEKNVDTYIQKAEKHLEKREKQIKPII